MEEEKVCFSKAQPKFIGFSLCSSGSEKVNDLIKSIVPQEVQIGHILHIMTKLENYTRKKMNPKYESSPF